MFTAVNPVRKAIALAALLAVSNQAAHAVGFGDMFNPGRWFGGDSNDYYYDEGPWGPHAPGPYGAPGYAPYGGHGYGYSPYGAPAYGTQGPAYGTPAYTAPALPQASEPTPETNNSAKDREIEALKRRIEQLESRNAPPSRPQPPQGQSAGEGWPSAPAFRPMDQY
ncbi:hypothetical protein U5801_16725 [Lamprobacter modestohalophilus]|uniref:hypothetical protein n=1 Tax=Lamprobacter modestohalophilus TaxID=1064514 RepID=UPI002ADEFA79|nr:hypothetical protein [Lamprobacter modestohalophilus]MEA1051438.1 hypothetical protein [Lamprobacter modestohalophilus]